MSRSLQRPKETLLGRTWEKRRPREKALFRFQEQERLKEKALNQKKPFETNKKIKQPVV